MAAIAYPETRRPVRSRPALVSVAERPVTRRPATAAVYRRRRAMALVVAVLVAGLVLVSLMALLGALTGPGGGPLAATGSAGIGPMQSASAHIHVVQPGETLWSIVRSSGRPGDPRPQVDRLAAQTGGRPLQVGQRLLLP
jgi:hypothetical protein